MIAQSADVYVQERDNSLYAPSLSPTSIGIVGTATKGPLNVATLCTSEGQLIDTFGIPRTKDYGMHAAVEALKACQILWYCRVAGGSQSFGTVTAQDAGSGPTNPSIGPSANVGPYNLANGQTISLTINGPTTHIATVTAAAASRLSGAENFDFTGLPGWGGGGLPMVVTINQETVSQTVTFLPGDFSNPAAATAEEVAYKLNATLNNCHATVTGGGTTVTLTTDRQGTGAYINITAGAVQGLLGFTAGELQGTGNVADVDAVTATEIKAMVELLGAGTTYSVGVGATGGISYITRQGAGGSAVTIQLNSASTAIGASPLINLTPLDTPVVGTDGAAAANTVTFTAATKGSHSSDITITVSNSAAISGTKKLVVKYRGIPMETYDKLWKNAATPMPTGAYAFITTINSGSTDKAYSASEWITCSDAGASAYNPANATYTLSAGNNGDDWNASSVIGTIVGGVETGMQVFSNPEKIDINILATPGISYSSVISAGLSLCQERADAIFVADAPYGLDPSEVVRWHNGDSSLTVTVDQESRTETNATAFNSSYGALYYPFVRITDKFNDERIWIPPSGMVLRTYAYTDEYSDPWFAPAGPNRTQSLGAEEIEISASRGERDLMYQTGNNVNALIKRGSIGIKIWGEKTLQRAPTALDHVHVRRLLLAIEKVISQACLYLLWEPNDTTTWRRFINLVSPFMDDVKARRGVYDFRIVADETTTTALYRDQNTMVGKIFLQPTKAVEKLIIPFIITPTGANYDEYAQA